jgi:hypothetical protein
MMVEFGNGAEKCRILMYFPKSYVEYLANINASTVMPLFS